MIPNLISRYPEDTLEFIRECKEEIENISVFEFRGDDFVEISPDEEIQHIKAQYIQVGVGEGYFDSAQEFYALLAAI